MSGPSTSFLNQFRLNGPAIGILICACGLTLLGLIILSSASHSASAVSETFFYKQLTWLVVAMVAGGVAFFIDLDRYKGSQWFWTIFIATVIGLVLVRVPGVGVKVNGAQRWLDLGPLRLQVSEFAKIGMTFALGNYLARNQRHIKDWKRGYIFPCIIVGVVCMLILIEPDFGTAFLCGVVGMGILFLAGARLVFLVPSLLGAAVLFGIAIALDPVRSRRITSFLDVEANRQDGAYQLWQGILAFGAGGVEGVGLGNGRQKMYFLPEAHTDFIFPIIGEELGMVFTLLVVFLFLMIFILGLLGLRRAPNLYQFSVAAGSLFFIVFQALINVGVVTGCLPTKGMSLPFISYGGSNLVVMFFMVGILMNCFRSWAQFPIRKVNEL
jgi:cell division protein FtsW